MIESLLICLLRQMSCVQHTQVVGPVAGAHELVREVQGERSRREARFDQLEARVRFQDLAEGEFSIGGIRVVTQYLHHPVPLDHCIGILKIETEA